MIINSYRFAGADLPTFGSNSRFFDGNNDFIHMGDVDGSVWQGANAQFSTALWIKPTTLSGNAVIFGKARVSNAQYEWALERQGSAIRFIWAGALNASSYWGEVTGNVLSNNVWTHVGVSYDGTQALADRIKIYIDGSLVAFSDLSAGTPSEIQDSTQPLAIGGTYTSSTTADFEFTGNIADVRIYDEIVSASEFANLEAGTDYQTNLVGWQLTDNDDVLDYAGSNDGTNNGSTYSTDGPAD